MRHFRTLFLPLLFFVFLFLLVGCGTTGSHSGGKPGPTPAPTPQGQITVTVAPAAVTVAAGSAFSAFVATVTNTSNPNVNWLVDNVAGGNTTVGTIDASGHYTAPSAAGTHTVTAVSVADPTRSGSAQVTVTRGITVAITPTSATVQPKGTQQFTANVSPVPNFGVVWSVDGAVAGNGTVGTVSSNGLYTAPAGSGTHTVTATSNDDSSKSASAQVTIPPGMAISPVKARVTPGATQQFTATVTDPALLPVTWSVDGIGAGNSSSGTIASTAASTATYTAPATAGAHTIGATSASNPSVTASTQVNVVAVTTNSASVLTFHNDGQRTGLNPNESVLSPANVNPATFGKLFSYPVDGQLYAQPLYVPGLANIAGATHNVVFAATEHNTVYAFDADGLSTMPLWQKNLGPAAPSRDVEGISPELGITGTPVIDPNTSTLYVVSDNNRSFKLHALDLHDGSEKFGGPVTVTATVPGAGADSSGGNLTLEGGCYQRPALALVNSVVFIAFGHCNHGWVLGYAADSLTLVSKFNTTPNGAGGAIWMGGGGIATDGAGSLYLMTGVDAGDPASGFNDAFLKLNAADLSVVDSFTPSNESFLRANDADLGSGAPIVLPDNSSAHPHELVGGGKDGRVFLIDRDHMGGFTPPTNPACDNTSVPPVSCDKNVQTIPDIGNAQFDNLFDTPAYWNGFVYFHPQSAKLQAFQYGNGMLSGRAFANTADFQDHGATPSVSANGNSAGIVWELQSDAWRTGGPAVLHAYDATNIATELYNSSQAAGKRDVAGPAVKFTVPAIANGHVYVGTANELDVYGLLSQ
ncbi:MAG TPA: Ig-like domain-containing protein [Terriglobales bacterium]|jgi:hypothetical protein|nr:Ig-like domain-containing protein [Terriglobales bacterium]